MGVEPDMVRCTMPDVFANIRKVILFNGPTQSDWIISYEDFIALGKNVSEKDYQQRAKEYDEKVKDFNSRLMNKTPNE